MGCRGNSERKAGQASSLEKWAARRGEKKVLAFILFMGRGVGNRGYKF